ncbi:MAG: hypothetical protein CSA35_06130 [Dethiosulfovibrio peptidovorans]|nr:MAG: hypothetical protein CSA35_06130 [Dethiosulfovibrio peptidovorans]
MSGQSKPQKRGSWFQAPPIITLCIALGLFPTMDLRARVHIGASFWLFIILVYLVLSTSYVLCLNSGPHEALLPLQLLTQGVVLLALPFGFGAPRGLSWIGLGLTSIGSILLIQRFLSVLKSVQETPRKEASQTHHLREVPLPLANIASDGSISEVNQDLVDLLNIEESLLLGEPASLLFPEGMDRADIQGKGWCILRRPTSDGSQLICLIEEPPSLDKTSSPADNMFHKGSELYSRLSANAMIPAEIKRSLRYRRWLSILLIRISLRYDPSVVPDTDWESSIYDLYGASVKRQIRECDMGFFMGGGSYIVLLPETPLSGGKAAVAKLKKLPDEVREELEKRPQTSVTVASSVYDCTGTEDTDYATLMKTLEDSLLEDEAFIPVEASITAGTVDQGT